MIGRLVTGILLVLCSIAGAGTATASVLLSDTLIVVDDRSRAGTLTVGAPGAGFANFEINDLHYLQDADGQLTTSPAIEANAAAILRVGPRRFQVEPGRGQQVRIAARPPRDLAPAEYRLHLQVVNTAGGGGAPDEVLSGRTQEGMTVAIPIRIARAVRVLYRHQVRPEGGRVEALSHSQEGAEEVIAFSVARLGATSLLARTEVVARDAAGNEQARWPGPAVSIYPELERRALSARVPAAEVPAGAKLCVELKVTDPGAGDIEPVQGCAG
jgi:fimbrial chaperone protein